MMGKIKVSDLTNAERERYIDALKKLLKQRYIDGDVIECPLCKIAAKVRDRMEPNTNSDYCDYCTWSILNQISMSTKSIHMPCTVILEKKFGIFSDYNHPTVIKYRKRTIPNEIKKLQEFKP